MEHMDKDDRRWEAQYDERYIHPTPPVPWTPPTREQLDAQFLTERQRKQLSKRQSAK